MDLIRLGWATPQWIRSVHPELPYMLTHRVP